jgi:quercetin dioxygenase-like cupin family protein
MKNVVVVLLSLCFVSVASANHHKGHAADAVFVEAKDVQWKPMAGFSGVYSADVEGDSAKGPHHSMIKFDAGFAAPLHHHTANHYAVVVAGTLVLTVDGQEHRLPAGSFFSFKNKGQHMTSCAPGAECILFNDVRGKWDVIPEKTEAKK